MARKRRISAGVVAVAVVALLWLFFAPTQLGGPIVYTSTVGNSMQPRFHKGDLALVRPASSYRVGDIVLYQSPVLHRAVLHRILVIQDGHYFFKGDHNTFVDPGYATRGDLLGKLWLRVPSAGKALSWIAEPTHSALIAAVAAFVLLFGIAGGKQRRTRRQSRQHPRNGVRAVLRRRVHKPRRTATFLVGAVALLVALVLVPLAFLSPLRKTVEWNGAYQNTGTFSYSAAAKATAAYPSGMVRTGQPLYLSLVRTVQIAFAYRFRSELPHRVHGTIALTGRLSTDSWSHTYPLHGPIRFSGDGAAVHATVDLRAFQAFARQLSVEQGVVAPSYKVDLVPIVHIRGLVGGKAVDSSFSPSLPFTLTQAAATPNPPQSATLPGAEYQQPSSASALQAALHPVGMGILPAHAPNFLTIARYRIPVSLGRGLGLGLLACGILLCLSGQFRRRKDIWSNEQRIAFRHQCVVVDVATLPAVDNGIEMLDFEQLAALAEHLDRPILRERRRSGDLYAVEDGARRYTHRSVAALVAAGQEAEPLPPPVVVPERTASPSASAGGVAVRAVGLLVVIGITVAAATAFTAGNTVPASHAGATAQTKQLAQLAPALCSSLALSTLVTPAGSYSGATPSELILGPNVSGSISLKGSGGDDCIVAGGGSGTNNALDGGSGTNVCIGSPTAKSNTFKNCAVTG